MTKRFLAILLALALVLQFFPVQVFAQELENETSNNVYDNLENTVNDVSVQDISNTERYTVLVLDGSGSMEGEPIEALKQAVISFCKTLLSPNNKVAIVRFGSTSQTEPLTDFTNNLTDIENVVDKIYHNGSTYVKPGLEEANELLNTVPVGAKKNMVVFSDGEPSDNKNDSIEYAHSLQDVDIYTIGFFQKLSQSSRESATQFLKDLCNKGYHDITDLDNFEDVFQDVVDDIKMSDQMSRYIQDHINYINGSYYENEIRPGLYGAAEEAAKAADSNWAIKGYDITNFVNNLLKGKVTKKDYDETILTAFIDSDRTHSSINNEYLSSLESNLEQIYFTSLTNLQANVESGTPGIDQNELNNAKTAFDQLKTAEFLSPEYKYSKQALDGCINKLIGTQTSQFKSDVSSALGMKISDIDTIVSSAQSTCEEIANRASTYQAYANTSDNFVDTLKSLSETVKNPDSFKFDNGKPSGWDDFQKDFPEAVDSVISEINASKAPISRLVMEKDAANLFMKNTLTNLTSAAASELIGAIPYVKVVRAALGGVLFAADGFLNAKDASFSAGMLKRLNLVTYAIDKVAADQSVELLNSEDQTDKFQHALQFDCAINMYQSALVQACKHGVTYHTAYMQAEFTKKQREHQWHNPNIRLYSQGEGPQGVQKQIYDLNGQLHDVQNIFCHGDGPFYEQKPNTVALYDLKPGEDINMYFFNCPITVNVYDREGNLFATLSDEDVQCPEGYEGYFILIPEGNGTCAKSIVIPSSFTVSFEGTGTDNITTYVTDVEPDSKEIDSSYWFVQKPVQEGSQGTIDKTDTPSSPVEMTIDGTTYQPDGGSDSAPDKYISYGPESEDPSIDPDNPDNPSVNPDNPSENPDDSSKPDQPSQPDTPDNPSVNPDDPSKPDQPSQPDTPSVNPENPASEVHVNYSSHVQDIGDQAQVTDGATSGTEGQSKRIEGIKINLSGDTAGLGIEYRTHVQNIDWQDYVANGELSGTTGQALRAEALQIRLTGEKANNYNVFYRTHVQDYGWMSWASNGQPSGSEGYSRRMEAVQVIVLPKESTQAPDTSGVQFLTRYGEGAIRYRGHVENIGWQPYTSDGATAGTEGQNLRLEAFSLAINPYLPEGSIYYDAYVDGQGWTGLKKNTAIAGTTNQAKALKALKINLTGDVEKNYNIEYRVHVSNEGWTDWVTNGTTAGNEGSPNKIEAFQVRLIKK